MYWKKLTHDEIKESVFEALSQNINLRKEQVLGIPATYLDQEEFYEDAPFLEDAPFISALIANPNHIGCHTLSEPDTLEIFKGTQSLEVELIKLCAEQIFEGKPDEQDGYIASGGTEANIHAMWIYRNYFIKKFKAKNEEIRVVFSQDTHYSIPKGADLLNLESVILEVDEETRDIIYRHLASSIEDAVKEGAKYFIVIMNLATTMFGSVDDIDLVAEYFKSQGLKFKVHVDAAFGGFIYPFVNTESEFTFKNKDITSITIDGHKMLQAPYGTGIFLIRKGFMEYVCTKEARYIPGLDFTLCGSRSGANAIAVWMILKIHGSEGWKVKMQQLVDRASHLSRQLFDMGVGYYRNPHMNIVAIKTPFISKSLQVFVPLLYLFFSKWPQKSLYINFFNLFTSANLVSFCVRRFISYV